MPGYGLSIDRKSCHNIAGLEGPIGWDLELRFNMNENQIDCNWIEGYYAHDSRTCLKVGQTKNLSKSIIKNDCNGNCSKCVLLHWNNNKYISHCEECKGFNISLNGVCGNIHDPYGDFCAGFRVASYLAPFGTYEKCTKCPPGLRASLAPQDPERVDYCWDEMMSCRGWDGFVGMECTRCENGMRVNGAMCE